MKTMTVGDFKTHFSDVLKDVQNGNRVGILYGKSKKPVAIMIPFEEEKKSKRSLGQLSSQVQFSIVDDSLSDEELINLDNEFSS